MAIGLEDKQNVNPADADFPYGDVRDKTPTVAGTKWDRNTMSDYIQFFHKMLDEAGITPNGTLDNDYNGFQMYEAFRKLTRPYKLNALRLAYGGGVVTATNQFNDIGAIVWTQTSTGLFKGTLAGAFVSAAKTNIQVQLNGLSGVGSEIIARCTDANTIEIEAYYGGVLSDNPMSGAPYFMIMVFD